MQVHEHIESFPKQISHYSRTRTSRQYLSPDLNLTIMYDLYLQKFEPETYKLKQDKLPFKAKICYDFYGRYFRENFNISFGRARKDTCKKCDILENKLHGAESEEEKKSFEIQKKLHILKSEWFYKELKDKSKDAEDNDHVETLSFDFQQNMPLPKVPSGDAFYLRQLWVQNFCIYSAKKKTGHFFMYDETICKKGANDVLSFLKYYIENLLSPDVKILYLFSDNCCAQNKNHTLVRFLATLCYTGRFDTIIHRFPEPGHSFLPCDRCFGIIEKKIRRIDRIFLPKEYMEIVKSSSRKFHVIPVSQSMVFNYTDHLKSFFYPSPKSETKEKFAISSYRVFKYTKNIGGVACSASASPDVLLSNFVLLKSNANPTLTDVGQAYSDKLTLKDLKYKNVMVLANEYVSKSDMHFYLSLKSDQCVEHQDSEVSDSDNNSDVE